MIRPATREDLGELGELEKVCFSDPWSLSGLEQALSCPHQQLWCAWEKGVLAGYVCLQALAGEGEILRIGVLPPYRRLGLGRELMNHAHRQIRRLFPKAPIYLEVRQSSTPARCLYESLGYEFQGMRRAYYRRPTEDAALYLYPAPKEPTDEDISH